MVVEVEHRTLGTVPIINRPARFAGAEQPKPDAPPTLGQQDEEIVRDMLGLDAVRIATLRASGGIA